MTYAIWLMSVGGWVWTGLCLVGFGVVAVLVSGEKRA